MMTITTETRARFNAHREDWESSEDFPTIMRHLAWWGNWKAAHVDSRDRVYIYLASDTMFELDDTRMNEYIAFLETK